MTRDEILEALAEHREELQALGIKSLALFGSAARDELTDQSDIDMLVDLEGPKGLFGLIRVKHRLEELLNVEEIDLITKEGLHPALRDRILAEAVDAL
ncbi:MAG: nucleotidyltransferase family protein [Thermodesulfobacteriota bacterium]